MMTTAGFDQEDIETTLQALASMVFGGRTIDGAMAMLKFTPTSLLELARDEYERRSGIIAVTDPGSLVDTPSNRWYIEPSDAVAWPALRAHLTNELPEQALEEVSRASRKVISLGSPPGRNPIITRGLVLGYVQSGKTTNYMSVIARAADIGYRLVIVMTGITENLRSQTQTRIESSLVATNENYWYMLTGENHDFSEVGNSSTLLANNRLIAVVKKNPARLRRLANWIEGAPAATRTNCPILVIDDEADQASINTGKQRRSTINALILRILGQPRAEYIAYTATPFANLLIDATQVDLYPRDFIVPLPKPRGYFGAEAIFGTGWVNEDGTDNDGYDVVRRIPDQDVDDVRPPRAKDAQQYWKAKAPDSLRTAIEWFVMATAARRVRLGETKHSSMLVHTTMSAQSHFEVRDACASVITDLKATLATADHTLPDSLRATWDVESARVPADAFGHRPLAFDAVWNELPNVLNDLELKVDNYRSDDRLNYTNEKPLTVLVVGGNTLSRGLTLEGLICSYFVRSAPAYDTLLQMGRWFGFRRGYEDLVRLWITDELLRWFGDLARVEEQIREEISVYEKESKKPIEVPVRIRTHPQMMITSAVKMRNAVTASVSFSARFVQTILFRHRDEEWLNANIDAVSKLVREAAASGVLTDQRSSGRPTIFGVDHAIILRFLANYQSETVAFHTSAMTKYIKQEARRGSLLRWNVVFMEPASGREAPDLNFGLGAVRLANRAKLDLPGDRANLKAITSTSDRVSDLNRPLAEIKAFLRIPDSRRPTDTELLRARHGELESTGLLCLYPIDKDSTKQASGGTGGEAASPGTTRANLDAVQHVIGAAMFFPAARDPDNLVDAVMAPVPPDPYQDFEDESELADALDEQQAAQEEQQ